MTKLTDVLNNLRKCKKKHPNWAGYPVYRQLLPADLKDKVRGHSEMPADGCIQDLQAVLTCWTKNDFEMKPCNKEIKAFQKCYTAMEASTKERKVQESQGLIVDEETNLSRRQVNALLKRFPQFRPKCPAA